MNKDFDNWNQLKKKVDQSVIDQDFFFHEREVWWCSLGVNVGVEADGKNEHYERPILIVKKFNGQMFWCLPLTSKEKTGIHYYRVEHDSGSSWVALSQIRTVSVKRLLRKIGMISESEFDIITERLKDFLQKSNPA